MKLNPIHWFFPPLPAPLTPLEVATREFVATQHALLRAESEEERAISSVLMFEGRVLRLRGVIATMSAEQG